MFSNIVVKRNFFWSKAPVANLKLHYSPANVAQEQKPVIAMIGWAGADPKHMEKYTQFYNQHGFHVASICPPRYHYKVPDAQEIGSKLEPIFENEQFKERPIIIHSFSMNGIRGIISLWKKVGGAKFEERIDGVIFDSAPSRPFPYQNGKAMMLSRPSVSFLKDAQRAKIHETIEEIRNLLLFPLLQTKMFRSFFSLFWYIQDKIQLPKHQLFLYSKADSMVPVVHLEEFIEVQKGRGNQVETVDFGDTEHVAHIRKSPDEYKERCLDFVKRRAKL